MHRRTAGKSGIPAEGHAASKQSPHLREDIFQYYATDYGSGLSPHCKTFEKKLNVYNTKVQICLPTQFLSSVSEVTSN